MSSVESTTEVLESGNFDARPNLEAATPSTPTRADNCGDGLHQSSVEGVSLGRFTWGEEVHLLKTRIMELERQVAADYSSYPSLGHRAGLEKVGLMALIADEADHRRWENGLHRYPKNQETMVNLGQCRHQYHDTTRDKWYSRLDREYQRPGPFALRHECGPNDWTPATLDGFNRSIDYQGRRLQLRQGFEWEMDRLYFMEEVENRRPHAWDKGTEEQRQTAPSDEAAPFATGIPGTGTVALPTGPKPRLNRVDWWAFRCLSTIGPEDACVMDILVGDPLIQDDLPYYHGGRYGYHGLSARKTKITGSQRVSALSPVERPLPERVRIHSTLLLSIIAKILGSDADALPDMAGESVVFIRPFKALVHCERPLRDWCQALERRFPPTSSAGDWEYEREEGHSGQQKNEDVMTKSPTALEHLKCTLEFIDTELRPRITHLHNPQCRKVFFSDLWHLFRPGTEVIGSDGKQAYRVVQVTSPPHRVVPSWQRSKIPPNKARKASLSVICVYIDFDGKFLGPVSRVFDFRRFEGARDVTALDIYPLGLRPLRRADYSDAEWKEMEVLPPADRSKRYRQKLIARGRQFLAVAGVKHMFYAGPTLGVRDKVDGEVMVDFETAFAVESPEQQDWKPSLETLIGSSIAVEDDDDDYHEICQASCCRNDLIYDDSFIDQKERIDYINSLLPETQNAEHQPPLAILPRSLRELRSSAQGTLAVSPDELLIMSYRVFGFVLQSRKWAQLDVTYLTDVYHPGSLPGEIRSQASTHVKDQNETSTAFDRLVLDESHKHQIESLVAQHFRDKKSISDHGEQVDIVPGKGNGLILLLHGAPGTGRTSTVEGIAELFQKPLLRITCGDLGTTPREVEKVLEMTFSLARRWDCVLLLDEADVFLAQRTKEDFQRNALVAVFLRAMEYYPGILFLTTSRVGDFDEAFTSRINICLYYPDLSHEMTVAVFELNLKLIEERFRLKARPINIERMQIASFASQHYAQHPDARWNGRQIRNACQNALALAEFETRGNNRHQVMNPDAVVTLSARHFEAGRDGHVEFTKYINKLYGTNSARRAHEDRLRALMQNPEDRHPGPTSPRLAQRAAFARAAQPPEDFPVGSYASSLNRPASHRMSSSQSPYHQYSERVTPSVYTARYSDRELNPPLPGATTQGRPLSAQPSADNRAWVDQQIPATYNDGNPPSRGYMAPRTPAPGRAEGLGKPCPTTPGKMTIMANTDPNSGFSIYNGAPRC
ncbi:hypothetical protein BO78DRAFT_365034 [Aspergillus sclerotiicarbonarius CBS 121057]|uniref:AAA+ ATPase domain-containing protein n=1 Tax=Aspergillus sclerotiicarbonarius (strain CBS 121057 / IBT 28362) TaxID=1448318 RepID=A0A319ENR2_ASPSB|nr:hypothetical protein BO78DRAFT_365034 [Aspergillus sclerotiicarbonarius CBS 121057]